MATPTPIGTYLDLVTHQYVQAPKFQAWLTAILQIIEDILACADSMYLAFDLDLAQGAQLDALGQILGQSRTVQFQPSGGLSPILDDTTYRLLLRATILKNHWDGTMGSLERDWSAIIAGTVLNIQDNLDMTMTVFGIGGISSLVKDLLVNDYLIPRPQGVKINFVFSTLPYLGFDFVPGYIAGFDVGHFV